MIQVNTGSEPQKSGIKVAKSVGRKKKFFQHLIVVQKIKNIIY